MNTATAIIPLRSLSRGKLRLRQDLKPAARQHLVLAMATDVLLALARASVRRVIVATDDDAVTALAQRMGVEALRDHPRHRGLSKAITRAIRLRAHQSRVLVVPGDLPWLTTQDIDTLLAEPADVVVAPTKDGGTGGLVLPPSASLPMLFGPGSATRHAAAARQHGHRTRVRNIHGFYYDVDTHDDLERVEQEPGLGVFTKGWLDRTTRPTDRRDALSQAEPATTTPLRGRSTARS